MPYLEFPRHLAGASILSLVLIIAGCSSGQSTTGSALSKEATACYSEYVDLHGDIKKAYKAQISTGITSQSEYGKAHYEGMGANEGRALPKGCGEYLKVSSTCYESYVDNHSDLTTAWQAFSLPGQDKSDFGKKHYEAFGKTEGRVLPKGCSYEYTPPPVATVDPAASYTDDQILAYMNCYPDLRNIRSTNAEKIAFGKAHIRLFGQTEGRTCGLVAAVAEAASSSSGGGGSLNRCAGITSSTSKAAGVFTSNAALDTAVAAWISNSATATTTYGEINTWDVSGVTDMTSVFNGKFTFNDDIGCWDVSNVTNMTFMFNNALAFDQDIGSWDVSSVKYMAYMFSGATAFNQNLSSWNVSKVENMSYMFYYAATFDQDIGSWDVSSVTYMADMFNGASAFNQILSSWNAAAVPSCGNFATGATAWLAAYSGTIANKTPPLSASLRAAGCGN
ncbi:BspA family leucine-rich repeat surface protein [Arenicellales bacterium IMCC56312]